MKSFTFYLQNLPPDFVTFHLKNKIPSDVIIKCGNGEGYFWKTKIEKVGDFYCFTHGWSNVVKDVDLGFGDFMVFSQIDESVFSVLIFSPNGCEKDLPKKITGVNNDVVDVDDVDADVDVDDDVDDDVDVDVDDDDGEDPFFMQTMNKRNRSVLPLAAEFVRLSGIKGGESIQIKNLDGEEFPVALRAYRSTSKTARLYLSTGWVDFRRINNLSDGDKCILKFLKNEGKICVAKIPRPSLCGKLSTNEVVKKKRESSPPHEHIDDVDADVDCEDEPANVIKRPRGRPSKQQR